MKNMRASESKLYGILGILGGLPPQIPPSTGTAFKYLGNKIKNGTVNYMQNMYTIIQLIPLSRPQDEFEFIEKSEILWQQCYERTNTHRKYRATECTEDKTKVEVIKVE